jgi:hypothetical protein
MVARHDGDASKGESRQVGAMLTYKILKEHKLKVLVYEGCTTISEWQEAIQNMRADPDYSIEYDVLIDVTRIERHFTRQDLEQMMTISYPQVRYAIIAPQDVSFGIARMYEMMSEAIVKTSVRVFREWEPALKWLGRDPDAVRKHACNSEFH